MKELKDTPLRTLDTAIAQAIGNPNLTRTFSRNRGSFIIAGPCQICAAGDGCQLYGDPVPFLHYYYNEDRISCSSIFGNDGPEATEHRRQLRLWAMNIVADYERRNGAEEPAQKFSVVGAEKNS